MPANATRLVIEGEPQNHLPFLGSDYLVFEDTPHVSVEQAPNIKDTHNKEPHKALVENIPHQNLLLGDFQQMMRAELRHICVILEEQEVNPFGECA